MAKIISTEGGDIHVDAPLDFVYECKKDETGNTIQFVLEDFHNVSTDVGNTSGASAGTEVTVTKDPKDDLGLSGGKYFTLLVVRNPSGSDDTLDRANIFLKKR